MRPTCHLPLRALLGALVLTAVASPPAHAGEGDAELPGTTVFFETYDTNFDGCVTSEEFRGSREVFRLLDVDEDGRITPAELGLPATWKPDPARAGRTERTRGMEGRGARQRAAAMDRLKRMDTDGDDRVSRDEWMGQPEGFARLDRNKDGYLDAQDVGGPDSADGGRGPEGAGRGRDMPGGGRLFDRLDANGDGVLDAQEIAGREAILRLDADGDGRVTREEAIAGLRSSGAPGAGARRGRTLTPEGLRRFDRNGDGKVDADEFPGNEAMFGRLDRNGDGVLDAADLVEDAPTPERPAPEVTPGTPADAPPGEAPAPDAPPAR